MEGLSKESISLIEMLLTPEFRHRLGYHGAGEVKSHPFFSGIEWDTLMENDPVFVPR